MKFVADAENKLKENEDWFSCEYQNHNEDWHNSCAYKEVEE